MPLGTSSARCAGDMRPTKRSRRRIDTISLAVSRRSRVRPGAATAPEPINSDDGPVSGFVTHKEARTSDVQLVLAENQKLLDTVAALRSSTVQPQPPYQPQPTYRQPAD